MSGDEIGYMFYLILLGTLLAGYFLYDRRQKFSTTVQQALIWVFIFALAVIAYGFKDTLMAGLYPHEARQVDAQTIAVSRDESGSFVADVVVNGTTVTFLVDTGASDVVLSQRDAAAVGIDPDALDYSDRAATANGLVRTAPVTLATIAFGDFVDHDIRASVNGGELDISLLGMSYLDRFDRIEIREGTLLLSRH